MKVAVGKTKIKTTTPKYKAKTIQKPKPLTEFLGARALDRHEAVVIKHDLLKIWKRNKTKK